MKLLKLLLCLCMLSMTVVSVDAQESNTSKEVDYSEIIAIFDEFYASPNSMNFYDENGNDITLYVLSKENEYKVMKETTFLQMKEQVSMIVPKPTETLTRSTRTVSWNDVSVLFAANYYVTYDATATIVISDSQNIISSSSSITYKDLNKRNVYSYNISNLSKYINAAGSRIDFTASHNVKYVSTTNTVSKSQTLSVNR